MVCSTATINLFTFCSTTNSVVINFQIGDEALVTNFALVTQDDYFTEVSNAELSNQGSNVDIIKVMNTALDDHRRTVTFNNADSHGCSPIHFNIF